MDVRQQEIKDLLEKQQLHIESIQKDCPHRVGCLSIQAWPKFIQTSIVWHRFNDGVARGFCTTCLRRFTPEDSDYLFWLTAVSNNTASTCYYKVVPITEEEYKEGSADQFCWLEGDPGW